LKDFIPKKTWSAPAFSAARNCSRPPAGARTWGTGCEGIERGNKEVEGVVGRTAFRRRVEVAAVVVAIMRTVRVLEEGWRTRAWLVCTVRATMRTVRVLEEGWRTRAWLVCIVRMLEEGWRTKAWLVVAKRRRRRSSSSGSSRHVRLL